MNLLGNYYKSGKFWIAEIPFIGLMDQGKTKIECLKMVQSSIELLMIDSGFQCEVKDLKNGEFVLSSRNGKLLACFILKRIRESFGYSIREVSEKVGHKSHTEYARHESGKTAMTIETFNRYIEILSEKDLTIRIA